MEDDDEEKDQSDKEIEWRYDEQDIGDGHEEEEDSRRDNNKRDNDGQSSSSSSGSSSSASAQSTPRCEPLSSQEEYHRLMHRLSLVQNHRLHQNQLSRFDESKGKRCSRR